MTFRQCMLSRSSSFHTAYVLVTMITPYVTRWPGADRTVVSAGSARGPESSSLTNEPHHVHGNTASHAFGVLFLVLPLLLKALGSGAAFWRITSTRIAVFCRVFFSATLTVDGALFSAQLWGFIWYSLYGVFTATMLFYVLYISSITGGNWRLLACGRQHANKTGA